jgi:type I restriction-modification system DNA methylase subunit/predicted type IV restriction endonuclease
MNKQEAKQQIQKLVEKYQRVAETGKIKSYNEAQTRNEFIEPLFEFLGWDMRNLTTDNEVTTEENVSGGRVDLAFRLGNIPVFFLEAKAMKVDLDEWKWAEQAINYSWNKSVTWAVLTDFESIKIFNAEIPPKSISQNLFIEIKCQDYINRFDQLWLLSKESFERKLLDKEAQKWGKLTQRKQVGEKLFEDLMSWRILLTKDFKKQNTLTDEELDEGVQRILDRLIFIRTAEDRKIEPNVLLSILRGGKANQYKQLTKVFRDFDDGFNSKLFALHYCEEWKASDKVIGEVIKGLYETKDGYRYDFSVISADVLGGIYEQYLSFVQGRKGEDKSKSKRKSQGIYYTPKYIVEFIIKETLGEVLKKTKPKEISKIKVLDPACGSGSFLTAAYDRILESIGNQSLFTKFDIIKDNIYGVDLDTQAVEIAQLNLLLKVLSQRTKLPTLQHNLTSGNSLVSGEAEKLEKYFGSNYRNQRPFNFESEFKEVLAQGGFDVIIGNPPYVFARGGHFDEKTKQYYYENFPLASYQLNTYLLFIDRAFRLLKKGSYFGFIIPNTWLTIDTFSPLRKFLLEGTSNLQIINIFDKVFGEANVDTCLLIFKKGKPNNLRLGEFKDGQLTIVGDFPVSQFKKNNYIINITLAKSKDKSAILEKISENSKPLSEYATASTGLKAYQEGKGKPKQTKAMKNERVFHAKNKKDYSFKKYLEGRDVCRYRLGWSGEYLSYGDWLAEPRKSVPFNEPRILVRQIPSPPPYSINSVFTDKELLNDINSMVVFDFKCEPLCLLAVLNSKITTFWFANTFDKFQRKTFPQFKVKELAIFPIPNTHQAEQEKIAKKAQTMLDLNKELQATSANTDKHNSLKLEIEKLDREIDEEVYKIYGLTDEEIKTIEQN